jgi:hypothetical protein
VQPNSVWHDLINNLPAILTALATLAYVIKIDHKTSKVAENAQSAADHAAVTASVVANVADKKLDQIHVLVNSRLSEALGEISALKASMGDQKGADAAAQDARIDPSLPK